MNRWLQDFAYKINFEWWDFALAAECEFPERKSYIGESDEKFEERIKFHACVTKLSLFPYLTLFRIENLSYVARVRGSPATVSASARPLLLRVAHDPV